MNIDQFLLQYRKPLFAPNDGAPAGGDAGAAAVPAAGDGGEAAPAGGSGGQSDAGAASADGGNDTAPGAAGEDTAPAGDGNDGKNEDGQAAEGEADAPFEYQLAEEHKQFQGDVDKFTSEVNDWVKANPDATAADALKWAMERQIEVASAAQAQISADFEAQIETWETEAKADSVIGGDNYEQNVAVAKNAIDKFGDDDLKTLLTQTGMGSHPAVIRFAMNAGKSLGDAPVIPPKGGEQKGNFASRIYGNKT